mmetsp:Transcript_21220/g.39910  ORF Transcript_21220/g.39910 Transcript_21220/m.39910 type:complete len:118 (-) Transcript_21220:18-371(-)
MALPGCSSSLLNRRRASKDGSPGAQRPPVVQYSSSRMRFGRNPGVARMVVAKAREATHSFLEVTEVTRAGSLQTERGRVEDLLEKGKQVHTTGLYNPACSELLQIRATFPESEGSRR